MAEADLVQDKNLAAVRRLEESFIKAEETLALVRDDLVAASECIEPAPGASGSRNSLQRAALHFNQLSADLREIFVYALCERAEAVFKHPSGITFGISPGAVMDAVGMPLELGPDGKLPPSEPTLEDVWQYLTQTYGRHEARQKLERETIETFVSDWLKPNGEVEALVWEDTRLVLTLHGLDGDDVFEAAGSHDAGPRGRWVWYYDDESRGLVRDGLSSLADVGRLLGASDFVAALEDCATQFSESPGVSKKLMPLSDGSELMKLQNSIVVKLPPELSIKLAALVERASAKEEAPRA